MKIAIHSDLREHGDQAAVYREMLSLFVRAEELGFDSGWVRSYHFRRPAARTWAVVPDLGVGAHRTDRA